MSECNQCGEYIHVSHGQRDVKTCPDCENTNTGGETMPAITADDFERRVMTDALEAWYGRNITEKQQAITDSAREKHRQTLEACY